MPMEYDSIEVSPAVASDVPELVTLSKEIIVSTYAGVTPEITREAYLFHVSGEWAEHKEAFFRTAIGADETHARIARAAGNIVGYCIAPATDEGALGITPALQGGITSLRLLHAVAEEHGAIDQDLFLTVVPRTPAVSFYRRLGFLPTGRDISDALPRLRGGQILPLVELYISPENAKRSYERLGRLLIRRNLGAEPPHSI